MSIESREERIAGAFAFRQMYNLLNEIGAASNPATPTEIAGRIYIGLKSFADQVEATVDNKNLTGIEHAPNELKVHFRQMAIQHLNGVYSELSNASDISDVERDWLTAIKISKETMDQVINGDFTKPDNQTTQTPDGP